MYLLRQALLALLFISPLFADAFPPGSRLQGTVTDSLGAPVYGALVSIPDLKTGALTDSNGAYFIEHLPDGKYLVQVHMLTYNTFTGLVAVSGLTVRDFRLTESILERSEVVITGSSQATEQRKSTIPISSIHLKELQEHASTNLIDAISRLPGVTQVTTGPAISKPIIRGLGSNRILVINDNIRQEGQQWGDEHGIEVDDYNVSRIEVLKGPASLAYGSDALAGVVNIITDDPLTPGAHEGNLVLGYQSNSGLASVHGSLAGNEGGLNWKAYGTGKASHDYRNRYDGYVYNSRFSNLNYGASLGLNRKWGYSRLSFSSFSQTLGIAEGDRDSLTGTFIKQVNNNGVADEQLVAGEDHSSYNLLVPRQRIIHRKLTWNSLLYLPDNARLGLTLGYQQNTRKEFEDVLSPDAPGLHFLLNTFSYDLKYFFSQARGWNLTIGINGMLQDNRNKGLEFLVPDYAISDVGVYAIARKDIGKWSLSGGLRYDTRRLDVKQLYLDSTGVRVSELQNGGVQKFGGYTRSFSNLTGSLGTSYSLTRRTVLKFNLAAGYRAPNIAELSANGVHEGTIRYEYGNKDLDAERSIQGDVGVDYNADHVYVNAALFANYISDFIYIRKLQSAAGNDSIPVIGNEEAFSAFQYDQGNALLYGGEFYMDLHPHPLDWLHLESTFSYVLGERTGTVSDSTQSLPYIPPARLLIGLRIQKRSLGQGLKNAYFRLESEINFPQDRVFSAYGTEAASPGYTLFHAGIGLDLISKKKKTVCTVVLNAENLFDTPYQNHLSRLRFAPVNNATGRQGIYNIGRNISLQLSVPFRF